MGLTSRECFQKTLEHQEPGKAVLDFGATAITGINANALARYRRYLGMSDREIRIDEPLQLLGRVEEDMRKKLGVDVVCVSNDKTMFGFKNEGWKPWVLPTGLSVLVPANFNTTVDESGNTYLYPQGDLSVPPSGKMPLNGHFFDNITRGSIDLDDAVDARKDFSMDFSVFSDEDLRTIEKNCQYYYNETEYGIIGGGALAGFGDFAIVPGPNVKAPTGVRDLPDFMMAHHVCPEYIHELYSMQLEYALKNAELFYQAVGNKIQAIMISGTDFGEQRGPYISPESYRTFYKPYHKKINDWVHSHTHWKTFYHSCGSIYAFLDDFAEAGIDILNPVQTSAAHMEPQWLKENYGDKFVFWGGGVNTQDTLPFGTPQEVYDQVRERLRIFNQNGGYVFNPVHNVQSQTSAENLDAMFRAVKDYNAECAEGSDVK